MLIVSRFMFEIGDVIVPKEITKETAIYVTELVIDDIHVKDSMYSVIDVDGDIWQASPLLIEDKFKLKEGAENECCN